MITDFDVVIVGSGPAGVSAAYPLVDAGIRVLMVDGGQHSKIAPPAAPFLSAREKDEEQWKWMVGDDFHALKMREAVSPKLRVPTHESVFADFDVSNRIDAHNFIAVGSLATGGLSNAWGCGVAKLSGCELSEFPFQAEEIDRSYEIVAKRIGISGPQNDDLSDYFGLDAWSQPPITMDALHNHLYEQYMRRRANLMARRVRIGRFRVAALSEDLAGRKACNSSGNCLWGCSRRALYSAADELIHLKRYSNFKHESGFVVDEIVRMENCLLVQGSQRESRSRKSISTRKIVMAAGTLATTRLALKALNLHKPVQVLSCPTAAFLLWIPRLLGSPRTPAFGYGQLSFVLTLRANVSALGATFATSGLPVAEFVRHLPLRRRYGVDLLKNLLSSCLVGNLFLPGHLSNNKAVLNKDGSLHLEGAYADSVPGLMNDAAVQLRKTYWQLGALLLPMSFTVGRPGGDIHYAGTLPMRSAPSAGETSATGELYGIDGVHVVDGACLPMLTEKSHTLTIMANADRIGRILAARWYNSAPK